MTAPVYVASKGRPHSALLRYLRNEGVEHAVVVEPHERADYLAAGAPRRSLRLLDEDEQGFGYARAGTLAHARADGHDWFWMLDDDITSFHEIAGGKARRVTARRALDGAEQILAEVEWGQAALDYQQYAWGARQPYVLNSYCDVAVAIRCDTPAAYRAECGVKLDRDFTMQVLAAGQPTVRVTRFAFGAPTMGTNAGGLYDEYRQGREQTDAETLARLWPQHATVVVKANGRPDAKIDWRGLAS